MQYYQGDLQNLANYFYQAGRPVEYGSSRIVKLMDLNTDMQEYHAKAGSNSMFDFSRGDPLANTHITDMHKDAGANLNFHGSSGAQEMGVINRF